MISEERWTRPGRADQARRLLTLLDGVCEPGDSRIVCGDFNVEPNSETRAILRASGLTELVAALGFQGTRSSRYTKPGRFADYMLFDRFDDTLAFDVVYEPEVSGHCPLILEL